MDAYFVGDQVQVREAFEVGGTPTDPNALTARVLQPDGTQVAYVYGSAPALVREGAGAYRLDLTPDAPGTWWVSFEATGAVQETREAAFAVRAAALCGVQDLEDLIQVTIPDDKRAAAAAAIAAATAVIRGYTQQVLTLVEADTLVVSAGRGPLWLPELPVVAVSAVSVDGTPLGIGEWAFEPNGQLVRLDPLAAPPAWPTCWAYGYRNVAVTYSHGYATLPDDLVGVCARVASRQYLGGLRAALVGPHARESDYAAVYQGEPLGETAGAYGPTSAPMLTGDEKRTLNRYRVPRLG